MKKKYEDKVLYINNFSDLAIDKNIIFTLETSFCDIGYFKYLYREDGVARTKNYIMRQNNSFHDISLKVLLQGKLLAQ